MKGLLFATVVGTLAMPGRAAAPEAPELPLLPHPLEYRIDGAPGFTLKPDTRIQYGQDDAEARAVAEQLAAALRRLTGAPLPVSPRSDEDETAQVILLDVDAEVAESGPEGGELSCDDQMVALVSSTSNGLRYASTTLLALFSPSTTNGGPWTVPACEIRDSPRFRWRGVHLAQPPAADQAAPLFALMSVLKLNALTYPAPPALVTNTAALDPLAAAHGVRLLPYPEPGPGRAVGPVLFASPEPPRSAVRYSGSEPARALFPLRALPLSPSNSWSAAAGVSASPDAALADTLAREGLDVVFNDERPDTVKPASRVRVLGGLVSWTAPVTPGTNDLAHLCAQADLLWRPASVSAGNRASQAVPRLVRLLPPP